MILKKATAPYVLLALLAMSGSANAVITGPGMQVENLNRGAVAIKAPSGVFISWRQLAGDPSGTTFNVYRGATRLNASPLATLNFTDSSGTASDSYTVRAIVGGVEQPGGEAGATWAGAYKSIPVTAPPAGVTKTGEAYTYEMNDGSAADLDGDGSYELIVKWQPTNAKDNSQSGYTGNTYLDAYKLDGTRMWRIDLGRNIRAGAHYTTFLAYDFDGDGQAEVMAKTADATVDGQGVVIGSASADHRNSAGYILSGPEYLTVFNGQTGAAMKTVNYLPARGTVTSWGDNYGNRVDRFLGGVANLDGNRPSAIFSRGYYTRAVVAAWDWRDGALTSRWVFDTNVSGAAAVGQGAHWFATGDANGDGKDDIVYGAATIDSYGQLLYTTGLGHGDALHFGKFDPNRPGQQVYMVHESPATYGASGSGMHDAATGALIWGASGSNADVGRGVCFDIDPAYVGEECWASRGGLRSATGVQIRATAPSSMNFGTWWDGDLLREPMGNTSVNKWNPATGTLPALLDATPLGAASNNSTKATPVLTADLFGDWREEIIWRNNANTELMVFSTTIPTTNRITTLMQNPQYRTQVAAQNAGYNQPPHPSFYLGEGATSFEQPPVHVPYDGSGTVQGENAIVGGGTAVRTDRAGYRHMGFLNFPTSGGVAAFTRINGGNGGAKTITIRYANGGPTPRTGILRVNGVAQSLTFRPAGSWTNWTTMTASVNLVAGQNNTLRFESTGQGLGNIDELIVP
ncbi:MULTISPECIES: carbohydrate-binding protein [unclassified Massilia]|uniref:rhamnogalacturonan lyase family protein n=1 Tax=unclassified Massilia TaxID=2609279 RepID=UPI00178131BD|nr:MULTISPECIES: carbohydrate-binding protein [unclassified Massilia]MBD8530069.1 carbohydrate-binding protein [Massilia sp. CFBP 13647]MBD8674102.1 carbohydrate-binding protein [Massilia sp. CFBP 13721]